MKIHSLELENFKIFKKAEFEFRKITLLAGANSAGKSTVLNALTAILQGSELRPFPFYFSNYGDKVHLGGFKDIVTGCSSKDIFSVGISFGTEKRTYNAKGTYRYATNGQQILVNALNINGENFSLDIKWEGQEKGYHAVRYVRLTDNEIKMSHVFASSFSNFMHELQANEDKEVKEREIHSIFQKIIEHNPKGEYIEIKKTSDLLNTLQERMEYKPVIEPFNRAINIAQRNINYIGPIRPHPSRHYFLKSYQEKITSQGENAFQILADWKSSDNKKYQSIVKAIKYLNLADDLEPEKIKDELVELKIKPLNQKHFVNICDVGFGISQILPVLVSIVDAKPQSTILINQPEVHLHPSSQAQLANYFISECKTNNFIIETHSEYLINRFRLLVSKGQIKPEDISIIYIDQCTDGPVINNVSINKHGALIDAPDSFFKTYYIDNNELILSSFGDDEDEDDLSQGIVADE